MTQRELITVIQQPGGYLHHPVFPGRRTDPSLGLHPGPGLFIPLLDHVAHFDLVEVEAGEGADGTEVFAAVSSALASIPQDRLAGVVVTTDGQIHDAPTSADALNIGAPLHQVMPGDTDAGDRRLIIEESPDMSNEETPIRIVPVRKPRFGSDHRRKPDPDPTLEKNRIRI